LKPSAIEPIFATLEQNLILTRVGLLYPTDPAALRRVVAAVLGQLKGAA
jgi:hypothetical protein